MGSFFHRYEWLKAVEYGIGLKAKHITISKDNNLIGIFPNFILKIKAPLYRLSSITPGFGGPIITTDEKEVLELMLKMISKVCRNNIISHQISALSNNYIRYGQFLEKNGYRASYGGCRFIIDLNKPYERIYSNMSSARRRSLNKVKEKKFDVSIEKVSDSNLNDFYKIHEKVMKRLVDNVTPLPFFNFLKNEINDRIRIFSASIDGRQVGQILCFLDDEQSSIHYFFSAIEEINFIHYPSELLHDFVIRWGIDHKYDYYDFGATSSNFTNSLFKFKEEFGGKAVPILIWEKGYSSIGWGFYQISKRIYHRLGKKL